MKKVILFILFLLSLAPFAFPQRDENSEYRITRNNLLEISIYNEPDLSKTVRVSADGAITFPLLGEVRVEGFTAKELEEKLRDLLEKDYLVNPQVGVFIKEFSKISVLGQVKDPGYYELKAGITMMDAIALAGGFTERADIENIILTRRDGVGRKSSFAINASNISDGNNSNIDLTVHPDDTITVPELGLVSVVGQVRSPGRFSLKSGMTAIEAIALAGGLTDIAAPNGTKLIRISGGTKITFNIPVALILKGSDKNKDIPLKSGDTIVVPESFF